MVFSSLTFLFFFLPIALLLYYGVGRLEKPNSVLLKNLILFLISLVFYAWGEPYYVLLLLLSTGIDYFCGYFADHYRGYNRAKLFLWLSVVANLSLLVFFKYSTLLVQTINGVFHTQFYLGSIALPIGISFYTFQTMSYTIDVYRGHAPVQKNFIALGAYVSMFPQLIAGPIVRYEQIAPQLVHRRFCFAQFSQGVQRFIVGLAKKVLLANNVGLLWTWVSTTSLSELSALSAVLGILGFGFQIYFDFSGYSDMAIGLGKMFGFEFPENFDHPYVSRSITEFWRRWHITLSSWFRDYVYIPLGGNRRGTFRTVMNLLIVWFLTGLWHGASYNFILWGLYYGLLLILEKLFFTRWLERCHHSFLPRLYTLVAVFIGWILFALEDFGQLGQYFQAIFANSLFADRTSLYLLSHFGGLLLLCILFSLPLTSFLGLHRPSVQRRKWYAVCSNLCLLLIFVVSIAHLVSLTYNPFLYFRF